MLYIILYVSGAITTLSVIGFFYQMSQSFKKGIEIGELKTKVDKLTNQITDLAKKINKQN